MDVNTDVTPCLVSASLWAYAIPVLRPYATTQVPRVMNFQKEGYFALIQVDMVLCDL